MNYNILLFDADETLFDFKLSEKEAFKQAMIDFGFDYDEAYHLPIYHEINTAIWKEFEQGLITQSLLKVERFKRLGDALGTPIDADNFAKRYMLHLANASFLYEGATELLHALSKHYRMAIITNGLTNVQSKRIRQSQVAHYFETIVISEEIGLAKPNAAIFTHTLDLLGIDDTSDVLMIGDSLTSDIQGGMNASIATCWYNPAQLSHPSTIQPTLEVSSLEALQSLLLTT